MTDAWPISPEPWGQAHVNAVQVKDIGKIYTHRHYRPLLFKDLFTGPFLRKGAQQFWALRGVSFDVKKGESVGIIGQNGAGKTTLLKILCGVTSPSEGTLEIRGRVSSLLELGAGFHHLLTGRENILLSGSILGMKKREVEAKIDDIAEFAEMVDFLDIPVRTYSAGMFLRLGFSVAVHADPDVLLIDEVLAVGDLHFQRKCIERIKRFKGEGKTIIIVSHNIAHVRQVCDRAIWLKDGAIEEIGPREKVIGLYLNHIHSIEEKELGARNQKALGSTHVNYIVIEEARLYNQENVSTNVFNVGQAMRLKLRYFSPRRIEKPVFGLVFHDEAGCYLSGINTLSRGSIDFAHGRGEIVYEVPSLSLLPGTYYISTSAHNEDGDLIYHYCDKALKLSVYHDPLQPNAERIYSGYFNIPCNWGLVGANWVTEAASSAKTDA